MAIIKKYEIIFKEKKLFNRFFVVVNVGLRDLDWEDELARIGIFERGRRISLFIVDVGIWDVIVLVFFWENVFIVSGSEIEWSSCVVVIKSLGNGVWMLRDWYFLSTIPPDLPCSGENYRVREKKRNNRCIDLCRQERYD